jgi:hypothetical protein
MKLWDILKTVGTGVIASAAGPAAPLVLGALNAVLPDDAQLPDAATGQQAQDALASIPAEARAKLMDKEFDVQITQIKETHSTARTMLETEAVSPHSTRPKIAYQSFQVVAYVSIAVVTGWLYAVVTDNSVMMKALTDGWYFVAAVTLPFISFLDRYFGKLVTEQKQKLDAAAGNPIGGRPSGGVMSSLISSITRK